MRFVTFSLLRQNDNIVYKKCVKMTAADVGVYIN
jgi:hypothetical protein